jgi:hypothetical protein
VPGVGYRAIVGDIAGGCVCAVGIGSIFGGAGVGHVHGHLAIGAGVDPHFDPALR